MPLSDRECCVLRAICFRIFIHYIYRAKHIVHRSELASQQRCRSQSFGSYLARYFTEYCIFPWTSLLGSSSNTFPLIERNILFQSSFISQCFAQPTTAGFKHNNSTSYINNQSHGFHTYHRSPLSPQTERHLEQQYSYARLRHHQFGRVAAARTSADGIGIC